MAEPLVFELEPRGDALTFRALISATESINRILRDVEYALTGDKRGRQWLVTKLSSSVPTITLEPMLDEAGIVEATARGIQIITSDDMYEQPGPPDGWTELALNDLGNMRRLFNGRYELRQVLVRRSEEPVGRIAGDIRKKVDRFYRGSYSLLGSLEGTLEAVNLHGRAHITIWERVTGKPVRVYLTKEWRTKVRDLLEKPVLAVGLVNYFANGVPRSITELRELRSRERAFRLKAAFGSVPDLTSGMETSDYLRAMRE